MPYLKTLVIAASLFTGVWAVAQDLSSEQGRSSGKGTYVGAVYTMDNSVVANHIYAYGRSSDGRLTPIGSFATGGKGGIFDAFDGLDPLISTDSIALTADHKFLLAVNAGSSSVSVFRVNKDRGLTLTDQAKTFGVGTDSIAIHGSTVYVSVVDSDGQFGGPDNQAGGITGFRLTDNGKLIPLPFSTRQLPSRPSGVRFSPDGKFLVVTTFNAGSATLASGSVDEVSAFRVLGGGWLSLKPVGTGVSTLPNNAAGRNMPGAIGLDVIAANGQQYVVATEAREFSPLGLPPEFDTLQTGSVSSWRIERSGALTPIDQDVLVGRQVTSGQRTTCWLEFLPNQSGFWVANALDASISMFSFNDGHMTLIEEKAAAGAPALPSDPFGTSDGFIDLARSGDGKYLYQLLGLSGTINVYETKGGLKLVQKMSNLPDVNVQGIAAF